MRLELYCKCGEIASGIVEPDSGAEAWRGAWLAAHQEPNCAPCTEAEAVANMPDDIRADYLAARTPQAPPEVSAKEPQ